MARLVKVSFRRRTSRSNTESEPICAAPFVVRRTFTPCRRLGDEGTNSVMSAERRHDDPHALERAVGTLLLDELTLIEAVVCPFRLFHANA